MKERQADAFILWGLRGSPSPVAYDLAGRIRILIVLVLCQSYLCVVQHPYLVPVDAGAVLTASQSTAVAVLANSMPNVSGVASLDGLPTMGLKHQG